MGVRLRLLTESRIEELGYSEDFKPHPSFCFAVSKDGRVLGRMGRVLKPKSQGKYHVVSYYNKEGKVRHKYVHRLVLETFDTCTNSLGLDVNHIDGDRFNNCLYNLELVTAKENTAHAISTGLSWNQPTKGQRGFIKCKS